MNPSLTDYVATILLIRPLMQSLLIFVLPERKLVSLETSLRKQSSYMGTYFYLYFFGDCLAVQSSKELMMYMAIFLIYQLRQT